MGFHARVADFVLELLSQFHVSAGNYSTDIVKSLIKKYAKEFSLRWFCFKITAQKPNGKVFPQRKNVVTTVVVLGSCYKSLCKKVIDILFDGNSHSLLAITRLCQRFANGNSSVQDQ